MYVLEDDLIVLSAAAAGWMMKLTQAGLDKDESVKGIMDAMERVSAALMAAHSAGENTTTILMGPNWEVDQKYVNNAMAFMSVVDAALDVQANG